MRRIVGMVLGLVLLAGCGAAPLTSVSMGTSLRQEIRIRLTGGKAEPHGERVSVARGTRLVLIVTADHADEVHVHGYDVEIPVRAGETVTREILLDQVGRFEVESHEPPLTVLELAVS